MPEDKGFDYEAATARIDNEIARLVEKLWPNYTRVNPGKDVSYRTVEEKANAIWAGGAVPAWAEAIDDVKRFSMLYEIHRGSFWHATDFWPDLKGSLTEDDRLFYATVLLEQAKRAHTVKNSPWPGHTYGYCWIVEVYDDSTLREFINDKLLTEAVNRGFWEMANEEFTSEYCPACSASLGTVSISDVGRYWVLMRYSEKLDLTRFGEFYTKPLVGGPWIAEEYIKAFERAAPRLDNESAGILAASIIQRTIEKVLNLENYDEVPEEALPIKLSPYGKFIRAKAVQDMFLSEASKTERRITSCHDWMYERDLKVFANYIDPEKHADVLQRINNKLATLKVERAQELQRERPIRRVKSR